MTVAESSSQSYGPGGERSSLCRDFSLDIRKSLIPKTMSRTSACNPAAVGPEERLSAACRGLLSRVVGSVATRFSLARLRVLHKTSKPTKPTKSKVRGTPVVPRPRARRSSLCIGQSNVSRNSAGDQKGRPPDRNPVGASSCAASQKAIAQAFALREPMAPPRVSREEGHQAPPRKGCLRLEILEDNHELRDFRHDGNAKLFQNLDRFHVARALHLATNCIKALLRILGTCFSGNGQK